MNSSHTLSLCNDFNLGNYIDVVIDTEGALNKNYFLTTDTGKYFVKSIREKRKDSVNYISQVEQFFYSNNIPAICMIKDIEGNVYKQYDDDIYTVYPFIDSDRTHRYSHFDYRLMGQTLAQIHKSSTTGIPDFLQTRVFNEKDNQLVLDTLTNRKKYIEGKMYKDIADHVDRDFLIYIDFKLKNMKDIVDLADQLSAHQTLPNDTLIHGDFHERNLLFSNTNAQRKIIGVCDFEKAEMGNRAFELARSMGILCFSHGKSEIELQRARELLRGYNEVFPIEKDILHKGVALRNKKMVMGVWIEKQHYDVGDSRSNKFMKTEMTQIEVFMDTDLIDKLYS